MGFVDKLGDIFTGGSSTPKGAGFAAGYWDKSGETAFYAELAEARKLEQKRKQEAEKALERYKQQKQTERTRAEIAGRKSVGRMRAQATIDSALIGAKNSLQLKQLDQIETASKELTKGIINNTYSGLKEDHIINGIPTTDIARRVVPYPQFIITQQGKKVINPHFTTAMKGLELLLASSKKRKIKINNWKQYPEVYQKFRLAKNDKENPYEGNFESWVKEYDTSKSNLIQEYEKYKRNQEALKNKVLPFEHFWLKKISGTLTKGEKETNLKILESYNKGYRRDIWEVHNNQYVMENGKKIPHSNVKMLLSSIYPTLDSNGIYEMAKGFQQSLNKRDNSRQTDSKSVILRNIPVIGKLFDHSKEMGDKELFLGATKFAGVKSLNSEQASALLIYSKQSINNIMKKNKEDFPTNSSDESVASTVKFLRGEGNVEGYTSGDRRQFGKFYVDLVSRLLEPASYTTDGNVTRQVFTNLRQQMPNIWKIVNKLSPATASSHSNYNSAVKSLAQVKVEDGSTTGKTTSYFTQVNNINASDTLLTAIGQMQKFAEKNPYIKDAVDRIKNRTPLSKTQLMELYKKLKDGNLTNYEGFDVLKEKFTNNPFMIIPYIEAAGFGNKRVQADAMNIIVDNVRKVAKPSKHKDNLTFYRDRRDRRDSQVDARNLTRDMITISKLLEGGSPVSENDALFQVVNKIGGASATGTGSLIARNIMGAFDAFSSALGTFGVEFKSFKNSLEGLSDEIESRTTREGKAPLVNSRQFQSLIEKRLANSQATYKLDMKEAAEKPILEERTKAEKLARHRLGLRNIILFKKVALTYKLAGLVQGDQSGGRTISNEDYAQVHNALWSASEIGNTANLHDLEKDLTLRINKGDALSLLIELKGEVLDSASDNAIESIFRIERNEFYSKNGREDPDSSSFSRVSKEPLEFQAGFLFTGVTGLPITHEQFGKEENNPSFVKQIKAGMINSQNVSDNDIIQFFEWNEFLFRQDQEDKGENLTHTGINHVLNLASKIYGSKKTVNLPLPVSSNRDFLIEILSNIDFSNFQYETEEKTTNGSQFIRKYLEELINKFYPPVSETTS